MMAMIIVKDGVPSVIKFKHNNSVGRNCNGAKLDTGYLHDGRANKDSYPHDGRADKDSYPHDSRADKDSHPHDRHNQYTVLSL